MVTSTHEASLRVKASCIRITVVNIGEALFDVDASDAEIGAFPPHVACTREAALRVGAHGTVHITVICRGRGGIGTLVNVQTRQPVTAVPCIAGACETPQDVGASCSLITIVGCHCALINVRAAHLVAHLLPSCIAGALEATEAIQADAILWIAVVAEALAAALVDVITDGAAAVAAEPLHARTSEAVLRVKARGVRITVVQPLQTFIHKAARHPAIPAAPAPGARAGETAIGVQALGPLGIAVVGFFIFALDDVLTPQAPTALPTGITPACEASVSVAAFRVDVAVVGSRVHTLVNVVAHYAIIVGPPPLVARTQEAIHRVVAFRVVVVTVVSLLDVSALVDVCA
eukprot:87893-Rhodomonas_salina.1